MPVRAALNVVYALQVKGMDAKERAKFDADLHGWNADNDRANRALWAPSGDDARPDSSGGES
jgi:hypothetical protein